MDEYIADDQVSNSDNECQIEKAERATEMKAWKWRKKCTLQAAQVKSRCGPAAGMQQLAVGMPGAMAPFAQPKRQVVPTETRPIRPHHFCGGMGHLRLYYLARAAAGNKKWYPSQVECVTSVDVQYIEGHVCRC